MLVLSRKPGEKLRVGDSITITIVRIGPNVVRLGIDAPRDLKVVREELLQEVAEAEIALNAITAQHEGPLEPDGGPCGSPILAASER